MNDNAAHVKELNQHKASILIQQQMVNKLQGLTVETKDGKYLYIRRETYGSEVIERIKSILITKLQEDFNQCQLLITELNGNAPAESGTKLTVKQSFV